MPADLAAFMAAVGATDGIGNYLPPAVRGTKRTATRRTPRPNAWVKLVTAARRGASGRAHLLAWMAGAIPFGTTKSGELWLYVIGDAASPARGIVGSVHPEEPAAPKLAVRDLSSFALLRALEHGVAQGDHEGRAAEARKRVPAPGVAEQEAVRAAFERARAVLDLVCGDDASVRSAARKLALRPLDVPHAHGVSRLPEPPPTRPSKNVRRAKSVKRKSSAHEDRTAPLALGSIVEAFFRYEERDFEATLVAHASSSDPLVRDAVATLEDAIGRGRTALARELKRRREMARRAARAEQKRPKADATSRMDLTRRILDHLDASQPRLDPVAVNDEREENLLALAEMGDPEIVPVLVARAVTGDKNAVDMLGALGDRRAVPQLVTLLAREPQASRQFDVAVVRALAALGDKQAAAPLRDLLSKSPMPSWREGLALGALVREVVVALGTLRDEQARQPLLEVLDERGQEYRAIVPSATWALGRLRDLPALGALERLLCSPKDLVTPETLWAAGEIGSAHPTAQARALALLDNMPGLEPGAEMVRLAALTKILHGLPNEAPRPDDLRRTLERALWEPAFRREETSRRRTWALQSLEELAVLPAKRGDAAARERRHALFLGHEAIRYFVTRDDHRVRKAAESAFTALGVQVPQTRRYYSFVLEDLERRGGLDALHDALRDPLGVFRHNVATRLSAIGHASSVRPLAEATARLFAEPPTSTYEYDDAPSHLVAFVRALARLNQPEGNDVLIEGLRTGNHHVRAVVAENAPEDPRFVPELMAMLGDPRSFLRSRAERSLATLGVDRHSSDRPPVRIVEV
ncbi:HEAT repeat domain-containing protein [Labilithrix luteola]|uniref:HEAT repeat domain-containing protein n=1 Tax=Labilithrix luteola TaxID=1391654 RepID=UPI0011BA741A|nr:HEAT repeat domain-containing protein [Labilithrix luteola]